MTTNVPALTIGPTGPVVPDASAVFAGCIADIQDAFGGDLSGDATTPQGQLATSNAATITAVNTAVLQLVAGCDPATSSGRMQDAIAAIYYLEREQAQATVVPVTCSGKTGTPIPINAKVRDGGGTLWFCIEYGEIPSSGSIDLEFACSVVGPVACPIGFIGANSIYQAIPGWDSAVNNVAGVVGNLAESRADFEYRRAQSVAINATGSTGSVLGALLAVPGVLDGWALENELGVTSGASFTGSITDNVLTVIEMDSEDGGEVKPGQMLLGAIQGTSVTGYLSGSGGAGTYTVSIRQTLASVPMTSAVGGVRMVPNSIMAVAYGGNAAAICAALLRKKNPGCNYNGNASATVQDRNPAYGSQFPNYSPKFLIPTPTRVKFNVQMQSSANVPTDAQAQIRAAMIATFTGTDGTEAANYTDASPKARIANSIFASRFYRGIALLGAWALIYKIQVGLDDATQDSILMRADQIPTLAAEDIAISFG